MEIMIRDMRVDFLGRKLNEVWMVIVQVAAWSESSKLFFLAGEALVIKTHPVTITSIQVFTNLPTPDSNLISPSDSRLPQSILTMNLRT
jgi:uncharacterized protein YfaA (DUF2138 family)